MAAVYGYPLPVVVFGCGAAAAILISIGGTCAASGPVPSTVSGSGGPRVRRLLVLAIVGAALWGAPGAFAAGWCGAGESTVDRPDATTGAQIHAIWVVPADSPDTFATGAPKMADDLASLSTWWVGQD